MKDSKTEAFRLKNEERGKNKKAVYLSAFTDSLFLWIFLAGILFWLASIADSREILYAGLPAAAVLSPAMVFLFERKGKKRVVGILLWAGLLSGLFFGFYDAWINGLHILFNRVVDGLGQTWPYLYPFYKTEATGGMEIFIFWILAVLAVAGIYLIKFGNHILAGILLVSMTGIQGILKLPGNMEELIPVFLCFLAVWIYGHSRKIQKGKQKLASVELLFPVLVLTGVCFLLTGWIFSETGEKKEPPFAGVKEEVMEKLEKERFEGESTCLPNGDFKDLGPFTPKDVPVLEVTMSRPESYYLRGFTGAEYTGTGWKSTDPKKLWKSRDLFYWLHKQGFYGQEILGNAACVLNREVQEEEKNQIHIENKGGSSGYYYVPYELQEEDRDPLQMNRQKIGDMGILTGGFKGDRTYSYEALSNQVIHYPAYGAKLLQGEQLSEDALEYLKKEKYYNEFVYDTYLDLPENLRAVLYDLLGKAETAAGEKHADYQEARQNIMYILTSEYTDDPKSGEGWKGKDLIADFLENTKTGHSVHFAGAAVMMFRYYGIPARYVEGYLITPEDVKHMKPDEPYILDETHAHAWAEFYQDGIGWLPFETTPSYINSMEHAEEFQDISGVSGQEEVIPPEEPPKEEEEEEEKKEENTTDWLYWIEIILAVLIFLFLLILTVLLGKILLLRHKSKVMKKLFRDPDSRKAAAALFEYSMNLLSVSGLKTGNESLYRYETEVSRMFGEETGQLYREIVSIRQEAVYSSHGITPEQRRKMEEFKNRIWEQICQKGTLIQKFQLKYIYFL